MISVEQAKDIIQQTVRPFPPTKLPLKDCFGLTMAADLYASVDIPAFEQSSMDGYALRFSEKDQALEITGEMAAGTTQRFAIEDFEASRIFTGAPLPLGADTVVMQEKVHVENGRLILQDPALQRGSNVRHRGAEVQKGKIAMAAGTRLSAAAIGFLAGIGETSASVYAAPSVSIILTGDELQQPGLPLAFGQVYEANSVMLTVALQHAGVRNIQVLRAADDLRIVEEVLEKALRSSDLVLLTGGVSVGDYDFVVQAAGNCGVAKHFHKIRQKPGKPLYFGSRENKLVFGLPGNPSSVLTCYFQYVLPAVEALLQKPASIKETAATLTHDYPKSAGLTHFLKAKYADGMVTPLHAQESFRLHSFAQADCFIVLEEMHSDYIAGEQVKVQLLPF
jgi:molybdopterin molybdotransferase